MAETDPNLDAPALAEAASLRAEEHFAAGRLEQAFTASDEAVRLDPSDAKPWVNRGTAKKKLGDLEGARQDYTHALEITTNPDHAARLRDALQKLGH